MTDIQKKQIIAVAPIDSLGYFEFSEQLFVSRELIYRLHLTTDENEVEVYLADFSEDGFGYNYIVFQAKKGDHVVLNIDGNRAFGDVSAERVAVETWQVLDQMNHDYRVRTFDLGKSQEGHLVMEHHKKMLDAVSDNGAVSGIVTAFFLLKEDVELSSEYIEAYKESRSYFYEVLDELDGSHRFYAERLSKELAVIDLQSNGDELKKLKSENRLLRIGIVLLALVSIVLFFFWRRNNKISAPLVELTQQEVKIQGLILEGFSNKEIAEQLFISLSTVKTHINSLYKKKGVTSRKELVIKESTRV